MDNFYYNLLNIGKKVMTQVEYESIIRKVVEEETKNIKKENEELERLCKVISININSKLKGLKIDTKIINTKKIYDMYEHQFILSSYVNQDNIINYYLIDPTYSQFKHKDEYDFSVLYPADFLNKTEEGKKLYNNLLTLGYSKINDNDLKRYIGSIMYEDDIDKIDINIEDLVLERRHK
jgi:hypothetical protein